MIDIWYYDNTWDRFFAKEIEDSLFKKGILYTSSPKQELHNILKVSSDEVYKAFRRCLLIYDKSRSKFHVLNHHDKHYSYLNFIDFMNRPDFGKILQCQYRGEYYSNHPSLSIYPFTYLEQDPIKFRSTKITNKKHSDGLVFRGSIVKGDGRKKREPVLQTLEDILIPEWRTRLPEEEYYAELAGATIALSIPGNGNVCHRELECFGLGTPVLMPKSLNSFYNPLIPDYHYISADVNWDTDTVSSIGDKLKQRYLDVFEKKDYLRFISDNALRWYETNVVNSTNLLLEILDV